MNLAVDNPFWEKWMDVNCWCFRAFVMWGTCLSNLGMFYLTWYHSRMSFLVCPMLDHSEGNNAVWFGIICHSLFNLYGNLALFPFICGLTGFIGWMRSNQSALRKCAYLFQTSLWFFAHYEVPHTYIIHRRPFVLWDSYLFTRKCFWVLMGKVQCMTFLWHLLTFTRNLAFAVMLCFLRMKPCFYL